MPNLFNIKSYMKVYKRTKLEVNNMHFGRTDSESYSNDAQPLDIADKFELKKQFN